MGVYLAWWGVHGQGACMAGDMHGWQHAWLGCVCGRGVHGRWGACQGTWQEGGMHGRGEGMHGCRGMNGQGACIAGGVCVAGETATAVDSMQPAGMHSC